MRHASPNLLLAIFLAMANPARPPASIGVVFDFDGTLVDDVGLLIDAARVVLRSAGFAAAAEADFDALRDMHPRRALEAIDVPIRAVPGLVRGLRREMRRRALEIEFSEEATESVRNLHGSGFTLAIMSSNSPRLIRSVIQKAELAHCFTLVARGGAVSDRAIRLRRVMRRRSAQARSWVFVGDEIRDLQAARGCGIPFVGVGWGVTSANAFAVAGASRVATTWSDLEETLNSLRSHQDGLDDGG